MAQRLLGGQADKKTNKWMDGWMTPRIHRSIENPKTHTHLLKKYLYIFEQKQNNKEDEKSLFNQKP